MPGNIDISNPAIRERIQTLCDARGLDARSLAVIATLDPRTVAAVLDGSASVTSAKTLHRIARALGTSSDHLLGRQSTTLSATGRGERPLSGPRRAVVVAAALALAVAGLFLVRPRTSFDPVLIFDCGKPRIGVRDAGTGRVLWDSLLATPTEFAFIAPWERASMVIYSTLPAGPGGGRLNGRDLTTGSLLWSIEISERDASRHFPAGIASGGRFFACSTCAWRGDCSSVCADDFDGDGSEDIVVRWQHGIWYPTCVVWYVLDPDRPRHLLEKGRYYTCGLSREVRTHDIDGDGRPGVVLTSTNNATAWQGAMLTFLDAAHWSGGSVDSVSERTHWRADHGLTDGSLARVVFPQFDPEIMAAFGARRLDVFGLTVSPDTITVAIGDASSAWAVVRMSPCFEVYDVRATADAEGELFRASEDLARRFVSGYLDEWVKRRVHFGAPCVR